MRSWSVTQGTSRSAYPSLTTSLRGLANVVVTVRTLSSAMHSGMFGGPAPDALAALIAMLATLRDKAGNTTITGLDATQTWPGIDVPGRSSSAKMPTSSTVSTCSAMPLPTWSGRGRRRLSWVSTARRSFGSSAAIQPEARARINLRVPPGMSAKKAQDAR